jgi:trans-feruloyl-CoA hydratase/vanillin synthase
MDLKEYFRETEIKGLAGTRQAQRESYGWWRRLTASLNCWSSPPAA